MHCKFPDARIRDMAAGCAHGIDTGITSQGYERNAGDGVAVAMAAEIANLELGTIGGDGQNAAVSNLVTRTKIEHTEFAKMRGYVHEERICDTTVSGQDEFFEVARTLEQQERRLNLGTDVEFEPF